MIDFPERKVEIFLDLEGIDPQSEEGKVKFQKIIDYNEDDCIATRVIKDWLVSLNYR